jgi:hypothetical protein
VPPKENPFSYPSYDLLRRAVFLESLSRSTATCHPAAYKLPYDAANQLKSYMQSLGFLDQSTSPKMLRIGAWTESTNAHTLVRLSVADDP